MNTNKLLFSVLRYSPSVISGETINLGVLFFSETTGHKEFFATKLFSRIHEFDDELDIDAVKFLLNAIADDMKTDPLTVNKPFDIYSYIRFYTKEFCFSPVVSVDYTDLTTKIEEVKRIYLRFDFEKSSRPNHKQELSFIRSILEGKGVSYRTNAVQQGCYSESIKFDFIAGDKGFKFFQFASETDLKKKMNDIKAWAWNSQHSIGVHPVIIYSTDISEDNKAAHQALNSVLEILKEGNAAVISLDDIDSIC